MRDIIRKILLESEYQFVYNCVSPRCGEELEFIIDNMEEVDIDEILNNLSLQQINEAIGTDYTEQFLRKDWAIRYYKINYVVPYEIADDDYEYYPPENIDAYVIVWSAIEFIFKRK